MVAEDKRLANDTSEETDGSGDAGAAALEVAEAAELESAEVGI